MNGNHITFQQMSDLYDNEIASHEERDHLMRHIAACESCALEYRRLGETIRLCGCMAGITVPPAALPGATMRKILSARKRTSYLKSMPAVAASLLIIAGAGLFNAGIIGVHDRANVADGVFRSSYSDSERVIDLIRKHNATISQVNDEYVEGTVPLSSFNDLRRSLGSRKVAYMPVAGNEPDGNVQWNNAMEEVGLGDGAAVDNRNPLAGVTGGEIKSVRFRVFK
jgi:hypothetical protein